MSTLQEQIDALAEQAGINLAAVTLLDTGVVTAKATALLNIPDYVSNRSKILEVLELILPACDSGFNNTVTVNARSTLVSSRQSFKSNLEDIVDTRMRTIPLEFPDVKYYGLPTMDEMIADGRAVEMSPEMVRALISTHCAGRTITYGITNPSSQYIIPRSVFEDFWSRIPTPLSIHTGDSTPANEPDFVCVRFGFSCAVGRYLSPYHQLWLPYCTGDVYDSNHANTGAHAYVATVFSDEPDMLYIVEPQTKKADVAIMPVTDCWHAPGQQVGMYETREINII